MRGTITTLMASLIDIDHIDVPGCEPGRGFVPSEQIGDTYDDYASERDPYLAIRRRGASR